MKICFFIWGLRAAGAERVLSFLANDFSARGWEVVILTMEDDLAEPFYPLAPAIEVRKLGLLRTSASLVSGLFHNLLSIKSIRAALRATKPSILVSFVDKANIRAILASRGLGIPIVISERTDPSRRSLGAVWETLRGLTYPMADAIVFQSRAVLEWFPARVRRKGVVIPNPVPVPPAGYRPDPGGGPPFHLVAMGRLFPVKGFDLLLRAFAVALAQVPGWTLDIWGEGPERPELEALAQDLGLAGHARLPGLTDNPFGILGGADLFVLSSRAEGFPNALVEAMACGLPVISTDFGGAARDIIRHGVNGLLVPAEDPSALATALVSLMADPEARAQLSARAGEVVQRFSSQRVIGQWEQALDLARRRKAPIGGDACPT